MFFGSSWTQMISFRLGYLEISSTICSIYVGPLRSPGARDPGCSDHGASLSVGGLLRTNSHWFLPALLIILSAITNGLFNPANSTAMIGMMSREHRGFAPSMNHVTALPPNGC